MLCARHSYWHRNGALEFQQVLVVRSDLIPQSFLIQSGFVKKGAFIHHERRRESNVILMQSFMYNR